ncbi:unnamed protein product [Urochloa humidicola]
MSSASSGRSKPSRSSSAIIADRPSGYHDLKIDACLLADTNVPTGEVLLSCPFTVGGHRWRIQTYPNGNTPEAAGYVSLFLLLDDDRDAAATKPVAVQMQFSVMVERRSLFFLKWKKHVASTKHKDVISFASKASIGYSRFAKRETLLNKQQRKGDPFAIRCSIVVHNASRAMGAAQKSPKYDDASSAPGVPPASGLSAQLGDLLSTERGADVVFEVGGETFAAHRAVLAARSPVFAAELFSAMREGDHAAAAGVVVVRIDDMEPRVFQALLRFAYTDSLPEAETAAKKEGGAMWKHLLVAADRYDMERLKLVCEDKLCKHIDVGTAAIILTLAEQHRCSRLKKACLDFIVGAPGNLKAVVASDGFEHLSTSCHSITKDLIAMLAF